MFYWMDWNTGKINKKNIEECSQDSRRFEKPIQKQKIISFTTEIGKQKITASNRKVLSACLMRNLLGSILYISLQRKVDMAQELKYPLTLVPLSLSHVDGTMLSTPGLSINGVQSHSYSPTNASIYLGLLSSHMQNFTWRDNRTPTLQQVWSVILSQIIHLQLYVKLTLHL